MTGGHEVASSNLVIPTLGESRNACVYGVLRDFCFWLGFVAVQKGSKNHKNTGQNEMICN